MSTKPLLVVYLMSYYAKWLEGVVNRNYFVTKELEKSELFSHILYVDFLPYDFRSSMRSIKQIYAMDRTKKPSKIIKGGRLYSISNHSSLFTAAPLYAVSGYSMQKGYFKALIENLNKGVEVISWSCNPLDTHFLDKELFSKTIFDTVDDWRFHSVYKNKAARIKNNYQKIAKKADYIFTVSEYLSQMYKKEFNRRNTTLIPNTSELKFETQKNELHKNKIVYLGTIERRFDFELVEFLANANPTKHFTFIGPVWKKQKSRFEKLLTLKNVDYKGELPFKKEIAKILPTFDAGIIPHHQSRFSQSNDPLKVYDYLRAGLPVISTIPTAEKSISHLIYLADTLEEFDKQLSRALDQNNVEKIKERREVMSKLTWKSRVSTMVNTIQL